jgi:hypothetical protein
VYFVEQVRISLAEDDPMAQISWDKKLSVFCGVMPFEHHMECNCAGKASLSAREEQQA